MIANATADLQAQAEPDAERDGAAARYPKRGRRCRRRSAEQSPRWTRWWPICRCSARMVDFADLDDRAAAAIGGEAMMRHRRLARWMHGASIVHGRLVFVLHVAASTGPGRQARASSATAASRFDDD